MPPEFAIERLGSAKTPARTILRAACAIALLPTWSPAIADSKANAVDALEEIVVTASLREQRAQDVAAPLQVVTGQELERGGATGFGDYVLTVPSASFRDDGSGAERIALRGISNMSATDFGAVSSVSTVGVYMNDIPIQGESIMPDLSVYDLNRIEILKGPQGTLYGDGAMGGAIKMIMNKPNLTHLEGKFDTDLSSTEGGAGNFGMQGVVNIPLFDNALGARIVGGYRSNGGFIENITRSHRNANGSDQYSVRALVLGKPTEGLSAEFLVLLNKQHIGEYNQITEGIGDLQLTSPEDRYNNQRSEVYALTLTGNLGFATLSSATAHYKQTRSQVDHYTGLTQSFFDTYGPVSQSPYFLGEWTKAWTEELRLVSDKGGRLDWVAGAFFRDETRNSDFYLFVAPDELSAVNNGLTASGNDALPADGRYIRQTIEDHYKQTAVYGEATIPLSKRIKLTGGARWFRENVSNLTGSYGWSITSFNNGPDFTAKTSDSGFVPKASIAFSATPDQLYYALVSKGYRASTINTNVTVGLGGIAASPDSLWNYEVGAKTSWANKRVTLNASAYLVKWSDIQIVLSGYSPVYQTYLGYVSNGGDAKIAGGEVALTVTPTRELTLAASVGYTHSKMTHVTNDAIHGAELPNSPPWTAALSAQYSVPMGAEGRGYVRVDATYVDRQATQVLTTTFPDGAFIDDYKTGNIRIGYERLRGWGASLFLDNVTNVRGQLGRGIAGFGSVLDPDRVTILRPRTAGISVHFEF